MICHSASSSVPGLSRVRSEMPVLPTACREAAFGNRSASSASVPAARPRRECAMAYADDVQAGFVISLRSAARPRRQMVCRRVSRKPSVLAKARCLRTRALRCPEPPAWPDNPPPLLETVSLVFHVLHGDDEQRRNMFGAFHPLEPRHGLVARHAGHFDIHQNQIRPLPFRQFQRFATVLGEDSGRNCPAEFAH